MTRIQQPFTPDWFTSPGDTIADILEELKWTNKDLAAQLEYPVEFVDQLIAGEAPYGQDVAHKLSQVLGSTPEFWMRREARYRVKLSALEQKQESVVDKPKVSS
ncbi:DNA-binding protein [Thalassoporum mexicanum PCC 7367]|uniref:helix-turn-helix transcriptional regulator n=1 Tax=Thalassoporum mexicanum TaxID=3457544 RepID=UPI00029F9BA6|nr:transcriptional regulator [Pseudanabaena sp. PCC 7367]AFY71231.1 DNA-binding protein [Pseudanabaena sp. PCC 7367]